MSWFKRCQHNWKPVRVTFSPPVKGPIDYWGFDGPDRFLWGVTHVTQQCEHCGRIDVTDYIGRVDIPGFSWKDAAA